MCEEGSINDWSESAHVIFNVLKTKSHFSVTSSQ